MQIPRKAIVQGTSRTVPVLVGVALLGVALVGVAVALVGVDPVYPPPPQLNPSLVPQYAVSPNPASPLKGLGILGKRIRWGNKSRT